MKIILRKYYFPMYYHGFPIYRSYVFTFQKITCFSYGYTIWKPMVFPYVFHMISRFVVTWEAILRGRDPIGTGPLVVNLYHVQSP